MNYNDISALFYYFKTDTLIQMSKDLSQLIQDEPDKRERRHYARIQKELWEVVTEQLDENVVLK